MCAFYTSEDNLAPEKVFIVHPVVDDRNQPAFHNTQRSDDESIEEISSLVDAINLEIVGMDICKVSRIQAGMFLGKGIRERIHAQIEELQPDVIVFNHILSPVQQRNLERSWKIKVIDRTGLILEIFGARAQTKEGRLQVELAALDYQKSRLVRSWTHLERQRGGAGFMGGPGETQIEIDRRLISNRISKLKKALEDVRRTRALSRKKRERAPLPVVALVGYTNAGKSTLFNLLTESNVFAKDLLFATLDPTMRRITLPNKQAAILSDTVGFISDLPTHLIAAFRATLEQTIYADVVVHMIDASRPDYKAQMDDVYTILEELGINVDNNPKILEVYNKSDLIDGEDIPDFKRKVNFSNSALISAIKGDGIDDMLELIAQTLGHNRRIMAFTLRHKDGKAISWLYDHAEVLERTDNENNICVTVDIEPANLEKFKSRYNYDTIEAVES